MIRRTDDMMRAPILNSFNRMIVTCTFAKLGARHCNPSDVIHQHVRRGGEHDTLAKFERAHGLAQQQRPAV